MIFVYYFIKFYQVIVILTVEFNYFIGKKKQKGGVNAEKVDNLGFGTVMILDERKIKGKYLFLSNQTWHNGFLVEEDFSFYK